MATKKPKQLTVAAMKKKDTQYNKQKTIHIDDYVVNIDLKFRPTKVDAMLNEYRQMTDFLNEKKLEVDVSGLIFLYLIKHFSDLEIPEDQIEQLLVLKIMKDNDYLQQIVESFDDDELNKVTEMMRVSKENLKTYLEQVKKEFKQIDDEVNKELETDQDAGVQ